MYRVFAYNMTSGKRWKNAQVHAINHSYKAWGVHEKEERDTATKPLKLPARERQVLNGIVAGLTTPQIAQRLKVGRGTIASHRQSLRRRLGVSSAAEMIQAARRYGMLKV